MSDEHSTQAGLYILHVQVHVKPDCVAAFREATLRNANASRREPGVLRFDVIQDLEDPTRFVFVEVYRSPELHAAHRETEHFRTWQGAVSDMMAEPRTSRKFTNVSDW